MQNIKNLEITEICHDLLRHNVPITITTKEFYISRISRAIEIMERDKPGLQYQNIIDRLKIYRTEISKETDPVIIDSKAFDASATIKGYYKLL